SAGLRCTESGVASRKLILKSEEKGHRVFCVRPAAAPTYVEYGAADIGIAGRDVLLETRADVLQPLDLNFGHCKIVVAGPKGGNGMFPPTVRIATKYPHITMDFFTAPRIPLPITSLSP